jgi:hypothetical protein
VVVERPAPVIVPGGSPRRRSIVLIVAVLAAMAVPSFVTGVEVGSRRAGGGILDELQPVLASSHQVDVPVTLRSAAAERGDLVTFVTEQDAGNGNRLRRMWRLDLGTGMVVPGPVVARVLDLRLRPGAEDRRLAYLVEGGGLFRLARFHASRPDWTAGGLSAFDLARRKPAFGAAIREVFAPWGSGAEVRIRTGPVAGRLADEVRIRGIDLQGVRVAGTTVYAWGTRNDHGVLLTVRGRRVGEADLSAERILDVAPDGRLLVTGRGGAARILPEPGGRAVPLRMEVVSVSGWSPGGRWMAAVGSIAPGVGGLWLVDTQTGGLRQLYQGAAVDAPAGFSSGDRLAIWSEPGLIAVLDLATRAAFTVDLPPGFPEVVGPLVAG